MMRALKSSLCKADNTICFDDNVNNFNDNLDQIAIRSLNSFEFGKVLGKGEFSEVKEAKCRKNGKLFAVKIVDKAKIKASNQGIVMLTNEVKILQNLEHPNIVKLHYAIEDTHSCAIATEMMSDGDLINYLSLFPTSFFDESRARFICKSILNAVHYLHSNEIGHRDIKPENILFSSSPHIKFETEPNPIIKLSDFGLAKVESSPNCFKTMCGTLSYAAPEILDASPYGRKCDMWSIGVVAYILLVGYQPFLGHDEKSLYKSIKTGNFDFNHDCCKYLSKESKDFLKSLLKVDPTERINAGDALIHPWFSDIDEKSFVMGNQEGAQKKIQERTGDNKVFFMIGSQRSGSNWIRTMIDEREDIAAPHPPHIIRDFLPIIEKFGDLRENSNMSILVDHVCSFVERNLVPWTDKHGSNMVFPRNSIQQAASVSCRRLMKQKRSEKLDNAFYLLSLFDAIMNFYTELNGKETWMCKSMGMSKFHKYLIEFYGEKRLRYIYLVRDPRDVTMSFMKTPVGDCHWYTIIKKWVNLQKHALRVLQDVPNLVHQVKYESVLFHRDEEMRKLYGFMGKRRFGNITRQASVLCLQPTEMLLANAKNGIESRKARYLSDQFKNLGKGEKFLKIQFEKWRHPDSGLGKDDLQKIESVAYETMLKLGYKPNLVGVSSMATTFTEECICAYAKENERMISKMNDDLRVEDPEDFERRRYQAEILSLPKLFLGKEKSLSPPPSSFLSSCDLERRRFIDPFRNIELGDGTRFHGVVASQRGYYPRNKNIPNQDIMKILNKEKFQWFSVHDGHGPEGHLCAKNVSDKLPELFEQELVSIGEGDINSALQAAHKAAHEQLVENNVGIDATNSGTTATTIIFPQDGKKCIVSNVGDSLCLWGSRAPDGTYLSKTLCDIHTPARKDERKRIEDSGGIIMTTDEFNEFTSKNSVDSSKHGTRDSGPLRIWSEEGSHPGCCFSRSIGDSIAHSLGVIAEPEVFQYTLEDRDDIFILASDGITEFVDEKTCLDIVSGYEDPSDAAYALLEEASQQWFNSSDYMDDISVIIIFRNIKACR